MSLDEAKSLSSVSLGESLSETAVNEISGCGKASEYFSLEHTDWATCAEPRSKSCMSCMVPKENISLHSEPIRKPKSLQLSSARAGRRSRCEKGAAQKVTETESELSFGEIVAQKSLESQSHRDPVVVFWERNEKQGNVENDIIVKFSLPGGEVFTQTFPKTSTVEGMKKVISEMLKVPLNILQIEQNGSGLRDSLHITEIAIERFGSITLQLISLDPERYPFILNNVYPDLPTNDVLTVTVNKQGNVKEIIVEIENRSIRKPFLGGYRHKVTNLEYHHAFTQTAPKPKNVVSVSRISQTLGLSKVVETFKEKFTQTYTIPLKKMEGNIIFGDPEQRLKRNDLENNAYEAKVLLIQRNLRSWLVRKMMLKMKEEYKRCIQWEKEQKLKIEEERERQRQEKEKAQTKPCSRGHFEFLYHNLEEWRKLETERIKNLGCVALRKSELYSLLEMEIQYINSIERKRIKFKREENRRKQEIFLERTASLVNWKGNKDQVIFLDTLETQRSRAFKDMYRNLQQINVNAVERINTLQNVKSMIRKEENNLVPELLSLLDREHCFLLRDLNHTNIDLLRDRISYLFLELIKDPMVNPEAKKYLPENKCHKIQMYKCLSCQNVFPQYKFSLNSKSSDFRKCHNCCWLREIGGPRVDVSPIRHILNAVRREELKQNSYTSLALVMQEQDFYHLIINIWLGHSAIGGSGNLEELKFGRWDFSQSWSPWNCILLTAAELKAHLRFLNPDQIYSPSFVKKIKQRHQMGRIYFQELAAYAIRTPNIREKKSGKIWCREAP